MDSCTRKGKLVVVGDSCRSRPDVKNALDILCPTACDVYFSSNGYEYAAASESSVASTGLFVCDDFSSAAYRALHSMGVFIIGPPMLTKAAQSKQVPRPTGRPQYCAIMAGVVVCLTGFKAKDELALLVDLVHHMGGAIRKEFSCKVTHLVANSRKGEKYRAAVSLGRPIMRADWIHLLWQRRDDLSASAVDSSMMTYRAPPLFGCVIALHGFNGSEQAHMQDLVLANGGCTCPPSAEDCTHLVVDENVVKVLPVLLCEKACIVKSEWFWASIQIEACADEELYAFELPDQENAVVRHQQPLVTPRPTLRSKKRKRALRDNLAQLASEGQPGSADVQPSRRRSSVDQSCATEPSTFLEATANTTCESSISTQLFPTLDEACTPKAPGAKTSPRYHVVSELFQTETNYCTILSNILSIFRDGSENPNQPKGALLSATDIKIIFGKIPPILELHKAIRDDLAAVLQKWRDDIPVARIILEHAEDMSKAYPPFINFFEETQQTIAECERSNPRFHAFLKLCERRPECGRQTLTELLINIVQRIPRIELLLGEILKYTEKGSVENGQLQLAQRALKDVMVHINEAKRNTEGQMVLFNIVNDIDNCPPNLLSATRVYVTKVDVDEVSDILCGHGRHLTLFVFADVLEVVKRRTRHPSVTAKSPAITNSAISMALTASGGATGSMTVRSHLGGGSSKPYKHVLLINLSAIKRVIDVEESYECSSVFSLVCRGACDAKETLYSFALASSSYSGSAASTPGEHSEKSEFLKTLCKHIASCCCRTDYESILTSCAPQFLDISERSSVSDLSSSSSRGGTLRRAADFGKRVSNALTMKMSMNGRLKRAVSSFLTPARHYGPAPHGSSALGSTTSLASYQSLDAGCRLTAPMETADLSPVSSVPGSPVPVPPGRRRHPEPSSDSTSMRSTTSMSMAPPSEKLGRR